MGDMTRPTALTGSDQLVFTGQGVYRGFTIRETAGSTAAVKIYDNTTNSGTLLETITLAANESRAECYTAGIRTVNGVYVDIISGTVEGSVRLG